MSVKEEIREFLTHQNTHHLGLSTLDALRMFKTTELRKIISDLNFEYENDVSMKLKVEGKSAFVPTIEKKNGKTYARYFLRSYLEDELNKTINAEISGNWLDGESDKKIDKFYHLEDRNYYKEKASNE